MTPEQFLKELKEKGNIYKGVEVFAYVHPVAVMFNKNEVVIRPLNRSHDIGSGPGGIVFLNLEKQTT